MNDFKIGDRVKSKLHKKNSIGTVIGFTTEQITHYQYVKVLRDGLKLPQNFSPDLLEKI